MSQAVETLLMLCQCLRHSSPAEPTAILPRSPDQWSAVIGLANLNYLTPALWVAIEDKGLSQGLPADGRDFLREAHRLNVERNRRLKQQALELVQALRAAGIRSVVLKGGIYLFEGDQRAFETRMMVDLDVLVPREKLEDSRSIAKSLGYNKLLSSDELFHHLDPMGRPGDLASIEIHQDVGMQRHILPAQDVLRDSLPVSVDGSPVYVPTPTHRALHCIYHSEVQAQSNYALGRIPLRYLHDMSLLRQQHEDQIDWQAVQNGMSRLGYEYMVPGFLFLAERLFGSEMPETVAITRAAKRHYAWCINQVRMPILKAIVSFWGAVTHVVRRPPIEYIHGTSKNSVALQLSKVRYLYYLIKKHRSRIFSKLSRVFQRIASGT